MKIFALFIIILLSVSCNRNRTEEFVTNIRSADELFRQGKDEEAMNALVKAEKCYNEDIPSAELGYLMMRKGDIYYRYYDYDRAIDSYNEGCEIFLTSGDTLNYCNALLLLCDASILNLDASRAHKCISIMQENARFYQGPAKHAYHLCRIKLTELEDGAEAAVSLIDAYLADLPTEGTPDWRILAFYYNEAGEYDKALQAIRKEAETKDISRDQNYYVVLYQVLKSQGDYEAALTALERHNVLADSLARIQHTSDTRFIEERHFFFEDKEARRRDMNSILLGFFIILIAVLLALRETRKRLSKSMQDNVLMSIEKERVEKLYADALIEREALNKMAEAKNADDEMKAVIKQRLALLNKVIASYITDSSSANKEANAQIEMLISNREAFLESTRKSFEAGHPKFMSYLRSRDLTDWEVNYCCLYLVGLNGKEIGEYINLKRHYTYGSVIRHKLGLGEHDKNLANHLKNLLENPPASNS